MQRNELKCIDNHFFFLDRQFIILKDKVLERALFSIMQSLFACGVKHQTVMLPQERDEWVAAIEQQILASLQGNESSGKKQSTTDPAGILAIRNTRGNNLCADCGAPGKV